MLIIPGLGCNAPGVHPWRDDSISPAVYGTASSAVILEAQEAPVVRVREIEPTPALIVRDEVPHWPLWWEDPFEDQGDGNNTFAWTWQDYFHMPYGLARFGLNTIALPVSAVVTPPGTPMVSDGRVEKTHDARRGRSPDPTAGPEDFIVAPVDAFGEPLPESPANGQAAESPPV